jgi:hypothetical protein
MMHVNQACVTCPWPSVHGLLNFLSFHQVFMIMMVSSLPYSICSSYLIHKLMMEGKSPYLYITHWLNFRVMVLRLWLIFRKYYMQFSPSRRDIYLCPYFLSIKLHSDSDSVFWITCSRHVIAEKLLSWR